MRNIDIRTLLPQQYPFVLIDRLVAFDLVITKTEFVVPEDYVFVREGKLTEPGIIENIAQTCAARMGYRNMVLYSGDIKLGYIGAIKNLTIQRLPFSGEMLETTIEVLSEVLNMLLVKATVLSGGTLIAECEMKIAEQ
ncbi:MAG: pseudouridylate synthase [Bacteroidales bacterium]|nr:pseudouridylate synthase [Bacteroidales bacterium]HOY39797.1 pseudouridylate synthase [Bacteroidales bacterium]HQP04675.1 pseudouridylate synthase [Bacteroidales bacterium]